MMKIQPAPESSQRNNTPIIVQTLTRNSTGPLQQRNDCLTQFLLTFFTLVWYLAGFQRNPCSAVLPEIAARSHRRVNRFCVISF